MPKTKVFLVRTKNDSGCPEIRAPRPGEYFIAEKTGKVVKRKSSTEPNMLRKIVDKCEVHPHFGLADGKIFERAGSATTIDHGSFFIGTNGKIGRNGYAKWSADGLRVPIRVVNGTVGAGTPSQPMNIADWKAKKGYTGQSDYAVAAQYAQYVSSVTR